MCCPMMHCKLLLFLCCVNFMLTFTVGFPAFFLEPSRFRVSNFIVEKCNSRDKRLVWKKFKCSSSLSFLSLIFLFFCLMFDTFCCLQNNYSQTKKQQGASTVLFNLYINGLTGYLSEGITCHQCSVFMKAVNHHQSMLTLQECRLQLINLVIGPQTQILCWIQQKQGSLK